MGPTGSENVKTLLPLQIAGVSFDIFPEFSSHYTLQNQVGI